MGNVAVIGAGVGGLGTAIRLAKAGEKVTVFEANVNVGGKINNLQLGDYRFDMGPSVLTAPKYIFELFELCNRSSVDFPVQRLETPFHYFFRDGTNMKLSVHREKLLKEFEEKLGENPTVLNQYLEKAKSNYEHITPLFIESSLHYFPGLLNKQLVKALGRLPKYRLNTTMHSENEQTFNNPKTHQVFDRFATYNGSDPYKAPAMLNMIQHLEMTDGVYLPKNGMVQIATALYELAKKEGVSFHFDEKVIEIETQNNKVKGLKTKKSDYLFDAVFSNMDVSFTYEKLLPNAPRPSKILAQEKSSSAMVFYWGINKSFDQLGVHNLFFSDDYPAEFDAIFNTKTLPTDPSIYIHITSKIKKEDAPEGKENWFVMINVPVNNGQDWGRYRNEAREIILSTLSKQLETPIEPLIEEEFVMDPVFIEERYSGKMGSIYGNASNNKFAAFYRHPNFSKQIKGLYFAGVTVHPGGGIPLALNSAKLAVEAYQRDVK